MGVMGAISIYLFPPGNVLRLNSSSLGFLMLAMEKDVTEPRAVAKLSLTGLCSHLLSRIEWHFLGMEPGSRPKAAGHKVHVSCPFWSGCLAVPRAASAAQFALKPSLRLGGGEIMVLLLWEICAMRTTW